VTRIEIADARRLGQVVLQALEEITGPQEASQVLAGAGLDVLYGGGEVPLSWNDAGRLQAALELRYGPRSGAGLAVRIGRACFQYCLREFGDELGLTEPAFRMLPLPLRLDRGVGSLAGLFNRCGAGQVRLESQGGLLLWHIRNCPLCHQHTAAEPMCYLFVGLLQEALSWLSGGKHYLVRETRCLALGDPACTLNVDQKSFD
jgi:predicted hydrocarbon binding protein